MTGARLSGRLGALKDNLLALDGLPRQALLGFACGLLAGGVIIAFRLLVELLQVWGLGATTADNFKHLSPLQRFLLPTLGGLGLGLAMSRLPAATRQVGVVHVMERLAYHQGMLPLRNALVQFLGAAAALVTGQSVGREGPSIHLGAAGASAIGQFREVPNNTQRVLVACGVAAAIAAGFNTPLAGVIFAMEVVMLEYTLSGFAPVILAAVSATALSRVVFGAAPAFALPALSMASVLELPLVLAAGLALGALAALFIRLSHFATRGGALIPLWLRLTAAGAVTGLVAGPVPEVMGVGYNAVQDMLANQGGWLLLAALLAGKLLCTGVAVGFGIPGGLIAPTLVIGAAAGGLAGYAANVFLPGEVAPQAFYVLIGMGAMMAATLQAPLAALTALLELTANPNIILPGMLAVIGAGLVSSEVFRQSSIYVSLLRDRGLEYGADAVGLPLRRIHVARAMRTDVVESSGILAVTRARELLEAEPAWIVIRDESGPRTLLAAADLSRALEAEDLGPELDLNELPGHRLQLVSIPFRSSLYDAAHELEREEAEALAIVRGGALAGILEPEQLQRFYRVRG
ncbi:MAG: chloride channel protein [Gammaproteobacteria bacterium]|nr:chloride channel protein [Gammaproteobacteria bacterium]